MSKNLGNIDRALRFLVGIIIAALYFANVISGIFALILLIVAAIFIITSFAGFCPLYFLLGIKSIKR